MNLIKVGTCLFAYIVSIWGGSWFVKKILGKYNLPEEGLKGAGEIIGKLERILILSFIFLDQYLAITIVLTAKSIARFEGLKKRNFAEYYLIGTFSSILFALFLGLIVKWILTLI